ncbi:MAG: hypothetical protein ACE5DM_01030 [Candidatus Nanoarchaeia archaeon]
MILHAMSLSCLRGTNAFAPNVPLWWHDGLIKYPSILLTESEVDRYVEKNLRNCFNDFIAFRNEFDFVERTNISSFTTFNEKDVTIKINYELDIIHRGSGKVTRRNEFIAHLPVKFKRMQEAAQEIIQSAVDKVFFEKMTFNLMSAMPDDQPDGLPLTGMMFQCSSLNWNMYAIRDRLMKAMRIVMTGVRFDNTDYIPFRGKKRQYEKFRDSFQKLERISDNEMDNLPTSEILNKHLGDTRPPADAYEYFQLFFHFTDDNKYKDLIAGAEYREDFGMDFLALPSSNGKMTSSVADFRHELMRLICLNYYHFIYRVRFPIVITIKDPDAYRGDGANFKFAYMVTIANNEPDKQPHPAEFFEPTDVSPDFCDPVNRNGVDVQLVGIDKITREELPRVNLSYQCFGSQCYLGQTETNNQRFQLAATLPEGCDRGVLHASKKGYLDTQVQFIAKTPFFIEMYPTINMSYHVMKRRDQSMHIARFLEPDEHVAVQISSKDPKYSYFTDYTEEDRFNLTHNIELVRSDKVTYDLNLYLFKTVGDKDILTGGWQGNWTPRLSELKDADKLTLQVVQKFPPPTTDQTDMMVQVYELLSNRSRYSKVNPETYAMQATPEEESAQE